MSEPGSRLRGRRRDPQLFFRGHHPAIRFIAGARASSPPTQTRPARPPTAPYRPTGSVAALIRHATGVTPYFVGKPNPLMLRSALNRIEAHSETTIMVGDRMDTDVVSVSKPACERSWY